MIYGLPVVKHPNAHAVFEFPFAAWLGDGESITAVVDATIQMFEGDGQGAAAPAIVGTPAISTDKDTVELELQGGIAPADCGLTITIRTSRTRPSDTQGSELAAMWPIQVRA